MQIDGRAALVTGGGSGLGAATARMLAERGARVVLLDTDLDDVNSLRRRWRYPPSASSTPSSLPDLA